MPRKRKSETVSNEELSEVPAKRLLRSSDLKIERLPMDVLVKVAKYVHVAQWPSLESVSRTFRDAIYEAWRTTRNIRLDDLVACCSSGRTSKYSKMTNLVLEKLTRRAVNISGISGFGGRVLNKASIDLLIGFEKLERVEFGEYKTSLDELEKFLKESASREKLKEVNASDSLYEWKPPGQRPLFEAFSVQNGFAPLKLEALDLSTHRYRFLGFPWEFLSVVDVSKLTSFIVTNTHVNRPLLANFLDRAVNLERLAFSFGCYLDEQLWARAQQHPAESGPSQLVLQLNKRIIQAVANLEKLASLKMNTSYGARSICICRNFDVEMTNMFNKLGLRGTLTELSLLPRLDTTAVMNAVAALPKLHYLQLPLNDVGGSAAVLNAQKSLMNLDVVGGVYIIPRIMANALHLKSLRLYSAFSITHRKEELLQIAAFKHLKDLLVDGDTWSNNIDDEVLAAWAEAFGSELESLAIAGCVNVTHEGWLTLINKTSRLRELSIPSAKITDRSLKEMAALCREIRKFDLSYCEAITAKGVQALVDGCERLKQLHVVGRFSWFPGKLKVQRYRKILFFCNKSMIEILDMPY